MSCVSCRGAKKTQFKIAIRIEWQTSSYTNAIEYPESGNNFNYLYVNSGCGLIIMVGLVVFTLKNKPTIVPIFKEKII